MKTRYYLAGLMMVVLGFVAGSCEFLSQGGGNDGKEAQTIVLTKSQQVVLDKGNDFGFKLLRETFVENGGGNVFLSPMGVTIVSSMLANGAVGETYDEIVAAIGMKGYSLDEINSCYSTMVSGLSKADPSVALSLANSIWVAKDLGLRKQFSSNMSKVFDAESFAVEFGPSKTLDQVNKWCSKKTSGLIPKMFDELDPRIRMLLINALYFKGDWAHAFLEANTREEDFQTISGQTVKMPIMALMAEVLDVYQDKTVSLVKMPYGNGAFYMEAILPSGDFKAFLENLSLDKVNLWDASAASTKVTLRFPKFKAEFDTDEMLVPVLSRLGMKRAFTYAADFSNMSDESLYVDKFRQKTYISVDEKGTEAAAVTVAEMRKNGASMGTFVDFNRPFIYLIRESSTGAILFIGTKVK